MMRHGSLAKKLPPDALRYFDTHHPRTHSSAMGIPLCTALPVRDEAVLLQKHTLAGRVAYQSRDETGRRVPGVKQRVGEKNEITLKNSGT
jgi:hypothetical protein